MMIRHHTFWLHQIGFKIQIQNVSCLIFIQRLLSTDDRDCVFLTASNPNPCKTSIRTTFSNHISRKIFNPLNSLKPSTSNKNLVSFIHQWKIPWLVKIGVKEITCGMQVDTIKVNTHPKIPQKYSGVNFIALAKFRINSPPGFHHL